MSTGADKWTINESLLQSYRTIFISSQSLFISAAALTTGGWIHLVIIGIAIFQLYIGFTVVRARALIVDYHKHAVGSVRPELTEKEYVHDLKRRTEVNKTIGISTNWRQTRFKVDVLVPLSFLIIWICFLLRYYLSG